MMKTTMQAVAVVPGKREVRLLEHAMPQISSDNHVKVRTLEVGVCGTDKEICTFVYGAPPQGFEYLVLGHEGLGEVVEVGSAVSSVKRGDLVVPSVRRPCEHAHCVPCRAGLQDFCSTGDFTERGIKMRHGYMTEYFVEDATFLTTVPAHLRDVAVLVEPLTVAEKGLAQVWKVQDRLPWGATQGPRGKGLRAVVLGAGPVGILGAMTMVAHGFETFVYSRSRKPNPKAELVESFGAEYISSLDVTPDQLAERVGNIDLVYEAVGTPRVCFDLLRVLGTNGVYVFTGIPAPKEPIPVAASEIMRNLVLKNQAVVGTVNADAAAFQNAINDLGVFQKRWPNALNSLITGRFKIESYRELLIGDKSGIKNVIAMG